MGEMKETLRNEEGSLSWLRLQLRHRPYLAIMLLLAVLLITVPGFFFRSFILNHGVITQGTVKGVSIDSGWTGFGPYLIVSFKDAGNTNYNERYYVSDEVFDTVSKHVKLFSLPKDVPYMVRVHYLSLFPSVFVLEEFDNNSSRAIGLSGIALLAAVILLKKHITKKLG